MRVIAGSRGGLRLRAPKGRGVRPTTDRAKETLFNVLSPRLPGVRVLDLFAGSGALGIEALSRGAVAATFVERSRSVAETLRDNLRTCRFEEEARVLVAPWRRALGRLGGESFEIVFLDPPWAEAVGAEALEGVANAGVVAADCLAVLEHPDSEDPGEPGGWRVQRRLDVGGTAFTLYGHRAEPGRSW